MTIDYKDTKAEKSWVSYWRGNPTKAWTGGNRKQYASYFKLDSSLFTFTQEVSPDELDVLSLMVQELVDYRLTQYEERLQKKKAQQVRPTADILKFPSVEKRAIPYFADLQIACGHFKSSNIDYDNIEYRELPVTYGNLDPKRHFIAGAIGDSMDGGNVPIRDGDYLLLERISPENAGSISSGNNIILVETQNVAEYDQYLLRRVKKIGSGSYQLIANNPNYEPLMATKDMATLARFVSVIKPDDMSG